LPFNSNVTFLLPIPLFISHHLHSLPISILLFSALFSFLSFLFIAA
jgi:hypothetical protein